MQKTVAIVDNQPIRIFGLVQAFEKADFQCVGQYVSIRDVPMECEADVVVVSRSVAGEHMMQMLADRQVHGHVMAIGQSVGPYETCALRESGIKGIASWADSPEVLVSCLVRVSEGFIWLPISDQKSRSNCKHLTEREKQVLSLIRHGFKNNEIAAELGIRPGTVKIHARHVFQKTGAGNRYDLRTMLYGQPDAAVPMPTTGD